MNKMALLPICILFLFMGCDKGNKIEKDAVKMTFDKLEPVSSMRVFTGNGIELDSQVHRDAINKFLDRLYSKKTNTGVIHYQSKFTEPDSSYGNATFTFYDNGRITYAAEIIEVNEYGDAIVMKSAVTNKVEDDPIITSDLFKYEYDINSNGSYNVQYVTHGDDEFIDVSLLYYKLVRYDDEGNRKSLAFGTIHNEFNESFVQTLTQKDTLAVKEYRLKYSVK